MRMGYKQVMNKLVSIGSEKSCRLLKGEGGKRESSKKKAPDEP